MKKTTYITTRFDVSDDFYVEVSEEKNTTNFVLCRENFGIKYFMFAFDNQNAPPGDSWEEIIKSNVTNFIKAFKKEFKD